MTTERERRAPLGDLYRYSGFGLQFAATVALFALGGHWLDERWGSSPWLLLVGVFLGFGLSLYSIVRKIPASPARRPRPPEPPCSPP